jgi:hypothetical protein
VYEYFADVAYISDGDGLVAGYACRWDGKTKPTPYPDWPIPGNQP